MIAAVDPAAAALVELRRARQRKRLADVHWVDALYHVYMAAILGLVALLVVSALVGGDRLGPQGVADVLRNGPALLGLVPALAVLVGLRSGSRGGPIALEAPDVRHVLLSPVDRGFALRGPALKQIRFLAFIGIVVGGIGGVFAQHRLGHNVAAFVVCGAAFGLTTVLLGVGCALVASGHRLPRWAATLIGLVLVAWQLGDLSGRFPTAPLSLLGRLPLWPLHVDPLALIPVIVAVALVGYGLLGVGGISIEFAERRTRLVGQLRFAVTLQDLRTVLVLRRQLSLELPRERPWLSRGGGGARRTPRFVVWARGWYGVRRWPSSRLVRLLLAAVVAGFALRGVWDGTLPLVVLAGLALWIAALDAIEPLAQETDHPTRRDSYPCAPGELMVRHLPVPTLVMVVVSLLTMAVFVLVDPTRQVVEVAAIALFPVAFGATAGAVVSALMGAPKVGDDLSAMLPPEIAGMKNALRTAWPPALAVLGVMPVLAARVAVEKHVAITGPAQLTAVAVLVISVLAAAWVRFRDVIHAWWQLSMQEAKQAQSARAGTRSGTADRAAEEDDQ